MRTLYLECNMGAAGDMLMSALAELLPDKDAFFAQMNRIGLPGVKVTYEQTVKCCITGTHVHVQIQGEEEESVEVRCHGQAHSPEGEHDHAHGHGEIHAHDHCHAGMEDIFRIVDSLDVDTAVKEDVKQIYRSIAEAESRVHGKEVTQVHFHEVGMADAIADITGCVMLFHELAPEKIIASPVNVGFGQVRCAHGILPVPAPATALLLEGIPCYGGSVEGELCTPTGAALLKYFVKEYRTMPPMTIKKIGYGMGRKDFAAANCIRAVWGECEEQADTITELCCNLDDMTAEELSYAMEIFRQQGALDVYTTAICMKKNRPGILLTVMCKRAEKQKFAELIFKHTSTIGIREYTCDRMVLERKEKQLETPFGTVRVKEASGFGVTKRKPEYEDIKKIADHTGLSLREVKEKL